jgi:hypothetical protein
MGKREGEPAYAELRSLGGLLGLALESHGPFSPGELAFLLAEELARPIPAGEAGPAGDEGAWVWKRISDDAAPRSLGDLLCCSQPPIGLLVLTKDYAKANRLHPDSTLPPEVATALYFACVAAALVRCGSRITRIHDAALRDGLAWASNRSWIGGPLRQLLVEALGRIPAGKE